MKNSVRNTDVARMGSSLTNPKRNFFRQWLEFIKPVHKMTRREMDLIAAYLQARYDLSRNIKDEKLLNSVLMSVEIKRKIRDSVNMTSNQFQVATTILKKKGVISTNGQINPRFIPNVELDSEGYKLILFFDFKSNDKR